jgi:RNA polymerase sigma factor (sigma-70 family)
VSTPTTRNSLGDQFQGILTAAQDGGEWAVAVLYRWLHPAVVGYLRSRAGADAEDLASETWLAVARGLTSFSGDEAAFRSWVFTIAHRRLVDHHRAAARRPRPRSLAGADGDREGPVEIPASDDPAGAVIAALAGEEAVRRIVALLPKDQADIVLLRVVAGLPVEDVAAITGRRPGTVRVLQHRALRRLADRLGAADGSPRPGAPRDL